MMENPNCKTCARKKHCFIKEFKVLYCEDYTPGGKQSEQDNTTDTKLTK